MQKFCAVCLDLFVHFILYTLWRLFAWSLTAQIGYIVPLKVGKYVM